MDDNEKLNLLFDMTEQQQAAIFDAIAEFKRQNARLETSGDNLQKVVKAAVTESMSGTAGAARSAVDNALSPALQNIARTIEAANSAKTQLDQAAIQLSWKMGFMALGLSTALIFSVYLTVWWKSSELATINANIASQSVLKGQINVRTCDGHPCVEIDSIAPASWGEYRILKGVRFK